MATRTVEMSLSLGHGWSVVAGMVGGAFAPFGSLILRSAAQKDPVKVGVDLDKGIILDQPPVRVAGEQLQSAIAKMNAARRELLQEEWKVGSTSDRAPSK